MSDLAAQLAGKYMTFQLAAEVYGLEILKVREIIRLMEIKRTPVAREFFRGVINLRGKIIPVIDLRLKLGMPRAETTDQAVIIVVQFATAGGDALTMGMLADQVLEVRSIEAAAIEPPPALGGAGETDFLLGVGKAGEEVIFLLDIARVLSDVEAREVALASAA